MSKIDLSGLSTNNSVSLFHKDIGIKVTRQKDGTIVTEKINSMNSMKAMMQLLKFIFVFSLFRECIYLFNLPKLLYHVPTAFWIIYTLIAIIIVSSDSNLCKYHGAEHKVINWYCKKHNVANLENIRRSSRINLQCGTNLLSTIVSFQIISSICFSFLGIHVPEIITAILPLYVYGIFPFNALGLLTQLITTSNPTDEHIYVAVVALNALTDELLNKQ